jgi:hypothetical protein
MDQQAKSEIHQILAEINYLIAAVFIVGAEIIGAINTTATRQVSAAESARVEPTSA